MKQTQVVALVLIALVLGIVIGMKIGKSQPAAAATTAQTGTVCPTLPTAADTEPAAPSAAAPAKASTKSGLPRLVDLGSTTCIPCKQLAPILEELKKEYKGKVSVEFLDVTKDPAAADQYKITVIPTQIFIDKDGKEVFRHEGFYPKADILAQFAKMGIPVK
ncbi:MAG: thioredoxin family protein [Armatimonadota bacterium]